MKTTVAVTLIITGTLIVLAPVVSDHWFQQNLVALMSRPGITSVNLDGKMGDLYRLACWLTGSAMIGVAVWFSLRVSKASEPGALAAQTI